MMFNNKKKLFKKIKYHTAELFNYLNKTNIAKSVKTNKYTHIFQ